MRIETENLDMDNCFISYIIFGIFKQHSMTSNADFLVFFLVSTRIAILTIQQKTFYSYQSLKITSRKYRISNVNIENLIKHTLQNLNKKKSFHFKMDIYSETSHHLTRKHLIFLTFFQ